MEPRITRIAMLVDVAVDAEVDAGVTDGQRVVRIRLDVRVAAADHETTRRRIDVPHRELPRSNDSRGCVGAAPSTLGWIRKKEST